MTRLAWLTDVHLNFADPSARERLCQEICNADPDRILLGGDIAEAPSFVEEVKWLAEACHCPIDFVLGNHDYYRSSIAAIRRTAEELSRSSERISWLPHAGIVRLTDRDCLIGHGGWGDARAGRWETSDVILNDYMLIEELRSMEMTLAAKLSIAPDVRDVLDDTLRQRLQSLGDETADHLRRTAAEALTHYQNAFVLMHVPPFLESCWHEGRLSDDNWSPHFVCAAAGEALREVMSNHPDRTMTVLCGHTHSGGEAQILPNLTVLTGQARYGYPAVRRVFELSS